MSPLTTALASATTVVTHHIPTETARLPVVEMVYFWWGTLMGMNSLKARLLVDAAHLAWSNRDIAGLLACYCEDVRYTCNTGPNPSEPFVAVGKQAMMDFLLPVLDIATSMSVVERFVFRNDVATATVACFVTHQATGHVLSGKYRQLIAFRDEKIAQIDEFHDAARIAAFWKLVNAEARVKQNPT